jgi:DNA repair photolyase
MLSNAFQLPNSQPAEKAISIKEVRCTSVLHKLNFRSSSEYTANFYRGCTHGCVYCYAPSLIHDERKWGSFVDAKVNAPRVLKRELEQIPEKEVVFLSSASDPYQPLEAKYKITRRALEVLLEYDYPVIILTRSPLVLRDSDLLRRFSWIRVGCSISSLSKKFYEPGVVSLSRRIETLRKLNENGITTWVSMAPIVPQMILDDVDALLGRLKDCGVACVTMGMLRFIGYEDSRIMFEERAKVKATNVMLGEYQIRDDISRLVSLHGLDKAESVLEWRGRTSKSLSLDNFLV